MMGTAESIKKYRAKTVGTGKVWSQVALSKN